MEIKLNNAKSLKAKSQTSSKRGKNALEIRDLNFYYGKFHALKNISFDDYDWTKIKSGSCKA